MTALIIRPITGRIEVRHLRAPEGEEPTNKTMFKTAAGGPIRPTFEVPEGRPRWEGYWTIAREHLTVVAKAIAIRDGRVVIEMHYSSSEQCDRRCQTATYDDCTCSCLGRHHGNANHAGWTAVREETLVRSAGEQVVTRTLTRREAQER